MTFVIFIGVTGKAFTKTRLGDTSCTSVRFGMKPNAFLPPLYWERK